MPARKARGRKAAAAEPKPEESPAKASVSKPNDDEEEDLDALWNGEDARVGSVELSRAPPAGSQPECPHILRRWHRQCAADHFGRRLFVIRVIFCR